MSPHGLIAVLHRNTVDDWISQFVGATSADKDGFRQLIKNIPSSVVVIVTVLNANRKELKP